MGIKVELVSRDTDIRSGEPIWAKCCWMRLPIQSYFFTNWIYHNCYPYLLSLASIPVPVVSYICIKCGFCYSCHWKKEEAEKRLLDNKLSEIFPPSLSTEKSRLINREAKQSPPSPQQLHQQQLIVDVHGRTSEPIYTYYRCNHKFSVHGQGSNACKCKHPTNKAHGVSLRVLLFLYTAPFLLLHSFYQIFGL